MFTPEMIEFVALAETLDEKDAKDLVHFAETNQIPIMSMNKFTELGFCDKHGRPTALAMEGAELLKGEGG